MSGNEGWPWPAPNGVDVALYLDETGKEGPTSERSIGSVRLPARPLQNDIIVVGEERYWVYRIEFVANQTGFTLRAYVKKG